MDEQNARLRDKRIMQTVASLAIATAMALLLMIWAGNSRFGFLEKRFPLILIMAHAQEIRESIPVTLAGIHVGTVREVVLTEDNRVKVTIEVVEKYRHHIRRDSQATLEQPLFGTPSLDISLGSSFKPIIQPGDTLAFQRNDGPTEVMAAMVAKLEKMDVILQQLEGFSRQLASPEGSFARSLGHLEKTLLHASHVTEMLATPRGPLQETLENVLTMTEELNKTREQLTHLIGNMVHLSQQGVATLSVMPGMVEEFKSVLVNTRQVTSDLIVVISQLKESAPMIPEVVTSSKYLVRELDEAIHAAKQSFLLRPYIQEGTSTPLRETPIDPSLLAP